MEPPTPDSFYSHQTTQVIGNLQPKITDAVAAFLNEHAPAHLAELYTPEMEVQVIVHAGDGSAVNNEFRGKNARAYTNGLIEWGPIRIPKHANSEPEFNTDARLRWPLSDYAAGIGMTGYNWVQRKSVFVAFDFDSVVGHKEGLTSDQLEEVRELSCQIPWVSLLRSTSGNGYHVYVFLEDVYDIQNHTEHAAVARAIMGKMSALTGFDFSCKVDTLGGNMWAWHREKYNPLRGFELLRRGENLHVSDLPSNWREHISVVKRRSSRTAVRVKGFEHETEDVSSFASRKITIPLDDDHRSLIQSLDSTQSWWDPDHHLLITHTSLLKERYLERGMKGLFDTVATGKQKDQDHNCFCSPAANGAWTVRRYGKGIEETATWFQDSNGWTTCWLNRDPDLRTAMSAYGGMESEKRGYIFPEANNLMKMLELFQLNITMPEYIARREASVRERQDGKLIIKVNAATDDTPTSMPGWERTKDKMWTKIVFPQGKAPTQRDVGNFDDLVRHLVTEAGNDAGWMYNSSGSWKTEPLAHLKLALKAQGYTLNDIEAIVGTAVQNPWTIVHRPFEAEYPGGREWNMKGTQFTVTPATDLDLLSYPTWWKILKHVGKGLDFAVSCDPWCKENGLLTGADYLKCWIASCFQTPREPTPYLFLYGHQNTGKTVLHESLSLLMTKGYVNARQALQSSQGFNGELLDAVICSVEEVDLRKSPEAYNRIKDWVTCTHISIHAKQGTPEMRPNTTHWIQCANDINHCPIWPGDTRIVVIHVDEIPASEFIARRDLNELLLKEAPHFLAAVLSLELPRANDRLALPVLMTAAKLVMEDKHKTPVERFLEERVYYVPGAKAAVDHVYAEFVKTIEPAMALKWSRLNFVSAMPVRFPRGRDKEQHNFPWVFGNMSLDPDEEGKVLGERYVSLEKTQYLLTETEASKYVYVPRKRRE